MRHRPMLMCLLTTCLLLAACLPGLSTPTVSTSTPNLPSLTPSETATPTYEEPTATNPPPEPTPSDTWVPPPTNTPGTPLPSLIPATITPSPAAALPDNTAAIQFYSPGPMSRVLSPVHFYGYAVPGYKNRGTVELVGEDGSLLASQLLQLNTSLKWAFFMWDLDFKVRGAGELARLSLTTKDEYGRLTAVQSLHLILLAEGEEIINPSGTLAERVIIDSPVLHKRITGGTLTVTGTLEPFNSMPFFLDLVMVSGNSAGSAYIPVAPGDVGKAVAFQVEVPYTVSEWTPVLLTLRQPDDLIAGIIYLFSQEIYLSP